jgi:hypothetical protein
MRTIQSRTLLFALVALLIGWSSTAIAQNGKSEKQDYNFAYTFCNDEFEVIEATGTLNFVLVRESVDENGCFTGQLHINSQNVTGTSQLTGAKYRIIDVYNTRQVNTLVCGECTVEIEVAAMYRLITKDGTSYYSRASYHVIIDLCNGFEVTEVRWNSDAECG